MFRSIDQESKKKMPYKLEVSSFSSPPVVGREIKAPRATVKIEVPPFIFRHKWYRKAKDDEGSDILLSRSENYKPAEDDEGFPLKLETYAVDSSTGELLCEECKCDIDTDLVLPSPSISHRRMIPLPNLEQPETTNPNVQFSDDGTFSVLSYDIHPHLSGMANSIAMFNNCPPWAATWAYRQENLLREIIEHNADIICLQEIQRYQLEAFFEHCLRTHGYSVSVMYRKNTATGVNIDGCATFYRRSRFKEIEKCKFYFGREATFWNQELERDSSFIRPEKVNLSLIVKLEVLKDDNTQDASQSEIICVANTRIYSRSIDNVYQIVPLIHKLETCVRPDVPLLICGNLNFLPRSNDHQTLVRLGEYHRPEPYHSMFLKSAYATLCELEGIDEQQLIKMDHERCEPLFTNFTSEFCGTVDYILYKANTLEVVGLLELLDRDSLPDGLPSSEWSSDHIALMAAFKIMPVVPPFTMEQFPPLSTQGSQRVVVTETHS